VKNELIKSINYKKNINNGKLNKRIVAVGECGLDFCKNLSERNNQIMVFIEQIKLSILYKLPLIIHTREAEKDTIEILKKYCEKTQKIHLHCFTDSIEMAKELMNFFPNLNIGVTTFKKAIHNRKLIDVIPLNRLMLETDGPYMSPKPFRGKISHPGYIPIVAQTIAKIKFGREKNNDDVEQVLIQCRKNVKFIYGI